VIVPGELPLGEIVPVRIDGAMTYDLTATPELNDPQVIGLNSLNQQLITIS
jgi:hypothetical protein